MQKIIAKVSPAMYLFIGVCLTAIGGFWAMLEAIGGLLKSQHILEAAASRGMSVTGLLLGGVGICSTLLLALTCFGAWTMSNGPLRQEQHRKLAFLGLCAGLLVVMFELLGWQIWLNSLTDLGAGWGPFRAPHRQDEIVLTYCGLAALMLSLVRGSSAGKSSSTTHSSDSTGGIKPTFQGEPSFVKEDIQSPAATSARPELAFDFPMSRGTDSTVDCVQLSSELKAKTWWKRLWWYRGQYLSGEQYFVRTLVASYLQSFFGLGFWWAGVVDYSRMKSLGHSNETSLVVAAVSPMATMITVYGYISDPTNPLNLPIVIGLLMFIPFHLYMWFTNSPHAVTRGSAKEFLRSHKITEPQELQMFATVLENATKLKRQIGVDDEVLIVPLKVQQGQEASKTAFQIGRFRFAAFEEKSGRPVSVETASQEKLETKKVVCCSDHLTWLKELEELFQIPSLQRQSTRVKSDVT